MSRSQSPGTRVSIERKGTDVSEFKDLADVLRRRVAGEVHFDEYSQILYANDGSIYQARAAGVVHPKQVDDVIETARAAHDHGVPILPRGAGSSLAGQAIGRGCIVLDFTTYMHDIEDVDPASQTATVQPGIVQDVLDAELSKYGLKFAPDPASSNRATVGGGIGNNSTGAHSVRYGLTDEYVEELEVVLANGERIHTREIVLDSPEWEEIVSGDTREAAIYQTVRSVVEENTDEIASRYPNLNRKVSGYNLDRVIDTNAEGEEVVNLSRLIVGAEGTLGIVVSATLSLVTVPEETALTMFFYDDLVEAMADVPRVLEHDVSAVELMDDEVFRLASESEGYAQYVDIVPDGAQAALLAEFDSELVDDFQAAVEDLDARFVENGSAFESLVAYEQVEQDRIWTLRKAAIPLLMSLEGDPKPYPFIEDATVPPEQLAEYVQDFEDVLADHDTTAAYFAHAGAGTLHIRPILNLKTDDDIQKMLSITEDVTDLVLAYHGAFSGEHGDGMARTQFNPKMYGDDLWRAFKTIKTAFDEAWLLNPGNVVYRDNVDDIGPESDRGVGADMREHLRYGASYQSIEPQTDVNFEDEGGFSHLVELCNGCGTCRQVDANVMCPTYRASRDELQTTRGRANMLRAAISGDIPEEELYSREFKEQVLDLCVGCKGCKNDCPTGVDLAKLKAQVAHWHHESEGAAVREYLFRDIDRLASLGSTFAPLSNVSTRIPGARLVMEKTLGIARERELPTFTRSTLTDWFEERGGSQVAEASAEHQVLLFPDTFTNYCYPGAGKAAVEVLEHAGVYVEMPNDVGSSGRAAYSKGFLDVAKSRAKDNVKTLAPRVEAGYDIVFVEPSDAVMFQDEYTYLLEGAAVQTVGDASYGIMEYLDRTGLVDAIATSTPSVSLTYHGHCNQKAINTDHHASNVLRTVGYDVDLVDSTCCGMAGSFGYEAEHYELSTAIGEILHGQIRESNGEQVTAPGASCRSQIESVTRGARPDHPVQHLHAALDN